MSVTSSESATSVTSSGSLTTVASVTTTEFATFATGAAPMLDAMPESFAARDVPGANKLFDVVCSIHSVFASSKRLMVAQRLAQEHNDEFPGHDAEPIERQ
jgi:hypothetical protein